jgi:hypothetical protein
MIHDLPFEIKEMTGSAAAFACTYKEVDPYFVQDLPCPYVLNCCDEWFLVVGVMSEAAIPAIGHDTVAMKSIRKQYCRRRFDVICNLGYINMI